MVADTDDRDRFPPLSGDDIYVFAHEDGTITVAFADGRTMQQPLPAVLGLMREATDGGAVAYFTGPVTEIGQAVAQEISKAQIPVSAFTATAPPIEWNNGANGLIAAARYGQDDVLDDLLDRGADVAARDNTGNTALHGAAFGNNPRAIDRLLHSGADRSARNDQGYTAEMISLAERQGECLRVFSDDHRRRRAHRFRYEHYISKAAGIPVFVLLMVGMLTLAVTTNAPLWAIALPPVFVAVIVALGWKDVPPGQAVSVVSIEGPLLKVQRGAFRRTTIDLSTVTAAAYLGPQGLPTSQSKGVIAIPSELGRTWPLDRHERIRADINESVTAARWPSALFVDYQRMWRDDVVLPVMRELVAGSARITPGLWAETDSSLALSADSHAGATSGRRRGWLGRIRRRWAPR